MKSEPAKTSQVSTNESLFAYTTWLVLGISMTLEGGRQLLRTVETDNLLFSYFMGGLQVAVGVLALWSADNVFKWRSDSSASVVRKMTFVLLIALVGMPLFLLVTHSLTFLFGQAETAELCWQDVIRLTTIAIYYLLAYVIVNLRLKNKSE